MNGFLDRNQQPANAREMAVAGKYNLIADGVTNRRIPRDGFAGRAECVSLETCTITRGRSAVSFGNVRADGGYAGQQLIPGAGIFVPFGSADIAPYQIPQMQCEPVRIQRSQYVAANCIRLRLLPNLEVIVHPRQCTEKVG